jgi:alginate O-acetyltransferase complex protein AlgI
VLPARWRTAWILLASYAFYAWWRLDFAIVFVASTVAAYLVGQYVGRWRAQRPVLARRVLALGIVAQLGTLAYFKYAEFGVSSLNAVLVAWGAAPLPALSVILPIGISFYVFQAVSYMVDVWRGDASAKARFVDVAAYIALFPQLIAGRSSATRRSRTCWRRRAAAPRWSRRGRSASCSASRRRC